MQIESILMLIPAIQVGVAAAAAVVTGYLMASSLSNKLQQRFGS